MRSVNVCCAVLAYYNLNHQGHILLKKNLLWEVPSSALSGSATSLSLVKDFLKDTLGLSGNWVEVQPKFAGMIEQEESLWLVYYLYVPQKIRASCADYEWVNFNQLGAAHVSPLVNDIVSKCLS